MEGGENIHVISGYNLGHRTIKASETLRELNWCTVSQFYSNKTEHSLPCVRCDDEAYVLFSVSPFLYLPFLAASLVVVRPHLPAPIDRTAPLLDTQNPKGSGPCFRVPPAA